MAQRTAVYVDFQLMGDFESTYDMIKYIEKQLSPIGLGFFLQIEVLQYIQERAEERFRQEGDDVVGKWVALASATETIRANLGYGAAHPINRRTGDLEDYITNSSAQAAITMGGMGAELIYPELPSSKNLEDKLRTAQFGDPGSGRQRPTPARPVIALNENDLVWVMSALAIYVTGARP